MLSRLSLQSSAATRGLFSPTSAAVARRCMSSVGQSVPPLTPASTGPASGNGTQNDAASSASQDPVVSPAPPAQAQAPLSSQFGALPADAPARQQPFPRRSPYSPAPRKTRNVPYVPPSQGGTTLAGERQLSVQGSNRHHRAGELYTPSDLDESQPKAFAPAIPTLSNIKFDVFKAMGTDPLRSYKDTALLSNFVTETGMLMHRKHTKLSAKNQRKLTKAVKRARAMGLMPHTYRMETEHRSRAPQFSDLLNLSNRS